MSTQSIFQNGVMMGRNQILCELLDHSDKMSVLYTLFRKASVLAQAETDPAKKAQLEAYSEGFRHSINILNNHGAALGAYKNVVNSTITIEITEEDVKLLGN